MRSSVAARGHEVYDFLFAFPRHAGPMTSDLRSLLFRMIEKKNKISCLWAACDERIGHFRAYPFCYCLQAAIWLRTFPLAFMLTKTPECYLTHLHTFFEFLPLPLQRQFFQNAFQISFSLCFVRKNGNREMCKNTLLLQAKFLKAPDRLSEHAKIVQFWSFFQKRRVFLCFFPPSRFPHFHLCPSR